jgi:hypothetical protein
MSKTKDKVSKPTVFNIGWFRLLGKIGPFWPYIYHQIFENIRKSHKISKKYMRFLMKMMITIFYLSV